MVAAQLDFPVFTLDHRVLLQAGTPLSSKTMKDVIAGNRDAPYRKHPFLDYGTIRTDILHLLRTSPYVSIFHEEEKRFALGLMAKMSFFEPVLDYIDYMKKNDIYTYRHLLMVFALSTILVRDLIAKSEEWIVEAMAGTLHDLGKTCVPLPVLKKTQPLSRTEKKILEHHTLAGFTLLSYYHRDARSFAARVAREHHERKDGSGYPLGISLKDRMVEIIAACDVYDALLSPRPYRPTPYNNRTALEVLTDMARDGKLGRRVVQALVAHNRKDRPRIRDCVVSTEKRGTPPTDNLYGIITDD